MTRDYNDPKYKAWRTAVYVRDKFTCRLCGSKHKRKLNAHHIRRWADHPHLRFEVSNGITLCYSCHQKTIGREEQFEQTFQTILSQKPSTVIDILALRLGLTLPGDGV